MEILFPPTKNDDGNGLSMHFNGDRDNEKNGKQNGNYNYNFGYEQNEEENIENTDTYEK